MALRSVWTAATTPAAFPPLAGEIEADVAIVGGGITGLSTAVHLARAGRRVVVLEAHTPGSGTTGHSTGNLYVPVSNGLRAVRAKWGDEAVRAVAASRQDALDAVARTVAEGAIACQFTRCPWHYYATPEGATQAGEVDAEFAALEAAGLAPSYTHAPGVPLPVVRAMRLDDQAQLDPYAYAQGLAALARRAGCQIHGHSAALEVDPAGVVRTAHGAVRCADIVLATHTPKGIYAVQMELEPALELGIACRLSRPPYPDGINWGIGATMHSLRSTEGPDGPQLIAISDRFPTGHAGSLRAQLDALEASVRRHFPVTDLTCAWGAQHFRSADTLPFIGRSHRHDNVYLATGFSTDGLVYGTLAAELIAHTLLGRPHPFAALYDARRIAPAKAGKAAVQQNLHVAKHLLQEYLRSAGSTDLAAITPGSGSVVDTDHGKLAVHRDAQGALRAVSAVCTHMGCVVHWNDLLHTWDCPCHGSRFDPDGSVLEGPALKPLEAITES